MKTLDPEWNQTLIFLNLPRDELIRQKLKLTLWDYDRYKSDDFMGELIMHLSGTFLSKRTTASNLHSKILKWREIMSLFRINVTYYSYLPL